jgi:hypothetical protein
MNFRVIFPLIYLLLVLILFAGHVAGAGHGRSLTLIPYISFPALQVVDFVMGGIESFFGFLLAVIVATAQYFLIGYLFDSMLRPPHRE